MAKGKLPEHWPIIAVVIVVALIFAISLISFQVQNTEHAVITRFGNPKKVVDPGLHYKNPWPIDDVWTVSNQIQYFEGETGKIEEVFTKDRRNINITTYILFKVSDDDEATMTFMRSTGNLIEARKALTNLVRTHRNAVIGQYNFSDMVTTETAEDGSPAVKLDEIEATILARVKTEALSRYGIDVVDIGFKHIGLPETVTQRVFERMRADRERESKRITAEGKFEAEKIRQEADKTYAEIVQQANSDAKAIMSEGDAVAAQMYKDFNSNPELAEFLAKLESLKRMSEGGEMTIIVDPSVPPFDILRPDVLDKLRQGSIPASDDN